MLPCHLMQLQPWLFLTRYTDYGFLGNRRSESPGEKHFVRTHSRDESGWYIVNLPFCENSTSIREFYQTTFSRLNLLQKFLSTNFNMTSFITESLGYI